MIRLEDDMLRPLPFGHVNFKSNMPSKKIYLSLMTGQDLFSALSTCLFEGGCFLKKKSAVCNFIIRQGGLKYQCRIRSEFFIVENVNNLKIITFSI